MTISSFSMAHGPAMRTKGRVPPILNLPETDISLVDFIVLLSGFLKRIPYRLVLKCLAKVSFPLKKLAIFATNFQGVIE
jgi:hypothetical protein